MFMGCVLQTWGFALQYCHLLCIAEWQPLHATGRVRQDHVWYVLLIFHSIGQAMPKLQISNRSRAEVCQSTTGYNCSTG